MFFTRPISRFRLDFVHSQKFSTPFTKFRQKDETKSCPRVKAIAPTSNWAGSWRIGEARASRRRSRFLRTRNSHFLILLTRISKEGSRFRRSRRFWSWRVFSIKIRLKRLCSGRSSKCPRKNFNPFLSTSAEKRQERHKRQRQRRIPARHRLLRTHGLSARASARCS